MPMSKRNRDIEAEADAALGPDPEDLVEESRQADRESRQARLERVGSMLSARLPRGTNADAKIEKRKRTFLRELARSGNVSLSCAAAGLNSSWAYGLRKSDADFAAGWDRALEFSVDLLEAAARRRAVDGTLRPVYQQGQKVGHVREYSDSLLTTLLKAHRPEKFRDNMSVQADVKGGVLVVTRAASDDDWEKRAAEQQAQFRARQGDE